MGFTNNELNSKILRQTNNDVNAAIELLVNLDINVTNHKPQNELNEKLRQLENMGFSDAGKNKRALQANNNVVENAIEWLVANKSPTQSIHVNTKEPKNDLFANNPPPIKADVTSLMDDLDDLNWGFSPTDPVSNTTPTPDSNIT